MKIYQIVASLNFGDAIGNDVIAKKHVIEDMGIETEIYAGSVAAKITESWDFYNDTCKISEDKGKHTGKPEVIRRYMDTINFKED